MEENCVFCKIIAGDIPSYTVYEDEVVKAFLDISQVTEGHVLVIPKKHVANLFEYDANLAGEVFSRIPKIARAIQKSNPNIVGLNLMNNNGEVAYQSVFHSHFHLLPRYGSQDGFKAIFADNTGKQSTEELSTLAQKISQEVGE
ncbi:HIT family protein [Ligilactobacillus equi]|uniref:Histidine triad (HIT) protein n=1 Tax=Ligilactobacillus equi DPC 6820 TaxID=1392007 RepID=V7HXZ0_9LACO|nr:HIT family protein [Ligilactobacillus equi]ETA73871.1 histidine triad (HIT) protein [Ligilactobacillus equi DPC 6820]MCQ2557127.1 HIT family protein [Ligilactobacillus sp.]